MNRPEGTRRNPIARRFQHAMIESADLLGEVLGQVEFEDPDEFLLHELARLIEDGKSSFEHEEFRFLIEMGIRLEADSSVNVRAQMIERLRCPLPTLPLAARRIAPDVIGTIEDIDSSMDQVGAVVRAYTDHLFKKLEYMSDTSPAEIEAQRTIEDWRARHLDRSALLERLVRLESGAVGPIADLLFDSKGDAVLVGTALEALSRIPCPVTARVLAHAVSEPLLEEEQEAQAQAILQQSWPLPRTYILYRLRQHTHEDIPFRWLELLVEMNDTRAVDRILEEVVAHASVEDHREDLLAILGLIDRSNDPGRTGKVLRLITEESAPQTILDLMEDSLEGSSLSEAVEEALERWTRGRSILVPRTADLHSFTIRRSDHKFEELQRDWNTAYHESLGWCQWSQFPRGPIETKLEDELQTAMIRELSLNPSLDDGLLRNQMDLLREHRLVTPEGDMSTLRAIYRERPKRDPWTEEVFGREVNDWYIRAAQYVDQGDLVKGRRYLNIVLEIEPEYPLAMALGRAMEG